jgi:multidrug efflux pump
MFARFFIDRPIFAWVLSLVIILGGLVAVSFLPIDQYPDITPPTVTVTANYPGADAQEVAATIGAPIEESVNGVENMMYMSSQSTNNGQYALTVTFEIGTDLNTAQVLVENRVSQALPLLPSQVQMQGVTTQKKSPSILLAVSLISPDNTYDELYLSNYATIQLRDELLRIKGVGDITIFGERDYAMRLWLDPNKLATRGLTAVDVVNAIKSQNVQVAAGQVGQEPVPLGQQFQMPMRALGRLETVKQFGDVILKTGQSSAAAGMTDATGQTASKPASAPVMASPSADVISSPIVHVRDVGSIEMGALNYDMTSRLDGRPSAGMGVFQLPGSNALSVAAAIKKKMVELKKSFPPGLDYQIIYDTTPFIQESVDDVFRTLVIAVLLVALVVLFFLQDWRAMILPMIDVPVSLVGTFAVMALLGYSLNNLTLFGLVLAIGIVVDDAIVVLENIERLIATGLDARAATLQAMKEITGPIIAITLVLASVFLPSLLVPGLTGQFYRQFAVTIAVAMIISALNALTLTPSRAVSIFKTEETGGGHEHKREALPWWIFGVVGGVLTIWLAGMFLPGRWGVPAKGADIPQWQSYLYMAAEFVPGAVVGGVIGWFIIRPVNAGLAWFFGIFNSVFERITAWYGWTVGKMMRLSLIVGAAYVCLLVLTWWGLSHAPTGFIPEQDQGYLLASVQLPDSASVQRTEAIMKKMDEIARKTPGVAHTVGVSGESFVLGTMGSNLGSMFVVLDPFEKRQASNRYDAVIVKEIQQECAKQIEGAIVTVFRAPPIRGLGNAGGFQLETEQHGFVDLNELQAQTEQLIAKANTDPNFMGVFTQFRAATPQLYVNVNRPKVESLGVPVGDVFTTLQVYMGGLQVNQFNRYGRTWWVVAEAAPQFRTNTNILKQLQVRNGQGQMVPFGTLARVENSTGPVVVMRYNMYTAAPVNGSFAPGVGSGQGMAKMAQLANEMNVPIEWTGIAYLEQQAGNVALLIFALGTVLVYLILAAKYESWKLPLAVILVVPLCILAAVTGMWIAGLPVDIFVQIGLLVLVGLASKNAILIVEYARQLHQEGKDAYEAALQASLIRFRPIIMTSLAFIFGVVPLVIAAGAGAEMRRSLGTAVFSGMIGVTLFGVFLTPVFFYNLIRFDPKRPAPVDAEASGKAEAGRDGAVKAQAEAIQPEARAKEDGASGQIQRHEAAESVKD